MHRNWNFANCTIYSTLDKKRQLQWTGACLSLVTSPRSYDRCEVRRLMWIGITIRFTTWLLSVFFAGFDYILTVKSPCWLHSVGQDYCWSYLNRTAGDNCYDEIIRIMSLYVCGVGVYFHYFENILNWPKNWKKNSYCMNSMQNTKYNLVCKKRGWVDAGP